PSIFRTSKAKWEPRRGAVLVGRVAVGGPRANRRGSPRFVAQQPNRAIRSLSAAIAPTGNGTAANRNRPTSPTPLPAGSSDRLGPVQPRRTANPPFEISQQPADNVPPLRATDLDVPLLVYPDDRVVLDSRGPQVVHIQLVFGQYNLQRLAR